MKTKIILIIIVFLFPVVFLYAQPEQQVSTFDPPVIHSANLINGKIEIIRIIHYANVLNAAQQEVKVYRAIKETYVAHGDSICTESVISGDYQQPRTQVFVVPEKFNWTAPPDTTQTENKEAKSGGLDDE